jgi:eukaryotic-like serine/threonine-protein kinase
MNPARTCPKCGALLPADAPQGHCPQCLLALAVQAAPGEATRAALEQATLDSDSARLGVPPSGGSGGEPAKAGTPNPAPTLQFKAGEQVRYFGDYELLEEIARGGMGVVWKARQVSLNRPVALKMILSGSFASEAEVRRFRTEAEAAANLDHPNIVPIYEVGEHEGRHYFSMKLVEGGSLAEKMRSAECGMRNEGGAASAPFHLSQRVELLAQVARAVHYAHQRGILHRDLKPANILLDTAGQPHITDFGLAKLVNQDSGLTRTEAVMGTPAYMAPEQAQGKAKELSTAADIYSLGAILYHLLTGRPPFTAETPLEVMRKVVEEEPASPSTIMARGDRDLETICLKCLEKDAKRRYASADALADELDRWLRNEPIAARPITNGERAAKWVRRKPAVAALTAATAVAVLLGIAGIFWQWRAAEAARDVALRKAKAEEEAKRAAQRAETKATEASQQLAGKVTYLELLRAGELLAQDETSRALALLAGILRREPTNEVAASRILSTLSHRSLVLPVAPALVHSGAVHHAEFSPDGSRVVTASADGTARIWNAETGEPIGTPLRHSNQVLRVAFSSLNDTVATASLDGTARVWDANSGQPRTPVLQHAKAVRWVHFSPDGRRLATASDDGTARLWSAQTGEPLGEPLRHGREVLSVEFDRSGMRVVTASGDKTVRVWETGSGSPVGSPMTFRFGVRRATFDPTGQWIAGAGWEWAMRIGSARTGVPQPGEYYHSGSLSDVQFSPDGARLLTTGDDLVARLWNVGQSGKPAFVLPHDGRVVTARFDPRRKRVVTASADKTARIWSTETGSPLFGAILHPSPVTHAVFNATGERLLTTTQGGTAHLWDSSARERNLLASEAVNLPQGLVVSADGRFVATWSTRGVAKLWDLDAGSLRQLWHDDSFTCLNFSPDSALIASTSRDKSVRLTRTHTGERIATYQHDAPVSVVVFSPDGRQFATGNEQGSLRVWETDTGKPASPAMNAGGQLRDVQFSADGARLVARTWATQAEVWNWRAGARQALGPAHHENLSGFTLSPDGRRVASFSDGPTVLVWEAATGKQLFSVEHDSGVTAAEFSPDGRALLTASQDRTARVWDAMTGRLRLDPVRHSDVVLDAKFSRDGRRIVTASRGALAQLWDAATGLALAEPFTGFIKEGLLADMTPAGGKVISLGRDGSARIWEMPLASGRAPDWLPRLAEAVAGIRLDARQAPVSVPAAEYWELHRQLVEAARCRRLFALGQPVFLRSLLVGRSQGRPGRPRPGDQHRRAHPSGSLGPRRTFRGGLAGDDAGRTGQRHGLGVARLREAAARRA